MTTRMLTPAVLPVFDPTWKAKCLACAQLATSGTSMRCLAVTDPIRWNSIWPCIDVRAGACGPDAVLWKAKP